MYVNARGDLKAQRHEPAIRGRQDDELLSASEVRQRSTVWYAWDRNLRDYLPGCFVECSKHVSAIATGAAASACALTDEEKGLGGKWTAASSAHWARALSLPSRKA